MAKSNDVKTNSFTKTNTILQDSVYRLVVSFYILGAGVNRKSKHELESFLKQYNNVKPEVFRWGREGEVDYCFMLDEMTLTQQADFVNKVCNLFCETDLINIFENKECVHKR